MPSSPHWWLICCPAKYRIVKSSRAPAAWVNGSHRNAEPHPRIRHFSERRVSLPVDSSVDRFRIQTRLSSVSRASLSLPHRDGLQALLGFITPSFSQTRLNTKTFPAACCGISKVQWDAGRPARGAALAERRRTISITRRICHKHNVFAFHESLTPHAIALNPLHRRRSGRARAAAQCAGGEPRSSRVDSRPWQTRSPWRELGTRPPP